MKARALVRLRRIFVQPLWFVVSMGFPELSTLAMALLYYSIGAANFVGFAVLGGVMVSFWGNVLWSMASQFNWDKQEGLFEIYLTSPASITAILIGMSVGGIIGTVPSAVIGAAVGWAIFNPAVNAAWGGVALTFGLTLASLYAMGMALSSLYLAYGRSAESLNEVLQEPVSMLSGLYFPALGVGSPFPFAVQAAASLIPLTVGMDALRKTLFYGDNGAQVWADLAALAVMAVVLLYLSARALKFLEIIGRRDGTIAVRIR